MIHHIDINILIVKLIPLMEYKLLYICLVNQLTY